MYIFDVLYGKIDFSTLVYKCMLSPEVQRLREVRLCNINSLCITGSANINRFEHSIGTAYLATVNINSRMHNYLHLTNNEKDIFIIAALLHDVANGPFGHSYEYIMAKKGFVPEQGLKDVLEGVVSVGVGAHKNISPFETIYFGKLRALNSILKDSQKEEISQIISGKHLLSRLISDSIDIDNIDNVFRMAYHMGIRFRREAPLRIAESMYIEDGIVKFLEDAKTYIEEWYSVRQKVYKFLLLNPQEFSGKYMLTEAMDILFECISQGKAEGHDIKWNYTDYQLMEELKQLKETWLKRKTIVFDKINVPKLRIIMKEKLLENQKKLLKEYIESIYLNVSIKEKGKTGESNKLLLSNNFSYEIKNMGNIIIKNRNMEFEIIGDKLFKIVNTQFNISQIVSRLMTGDLYHCLAILETSDINKYDDFLEYAQRIAIEDELGVKIRAFAKFSSLKIGIHPILDVNKTERQLIVNFKDIDTSLTIGDASSKKMLLGIFIKNEPYGLKHMRLLPKDKQKKILSIVLEYFDSYFVDGVKNVPLYEEVDIYG